MKVNKKIIMKQRMQFKVKYTKYPRYQTYLYQRKHLIFKKITK